MIDSASFFPTIFGRGLLQELRHFVHRPYLVVTMTDLWPRFAAQLDEHLAGVHLVDTLEQEPLQRAIAALPAANAVIGLGGGQALDVAKLIAWTRRLPLFQVPTALTVDAAWGHRSAVRVDGQVRYIGWARPEAVYVDFEVIQAAPPHLNRSGIGDVLCYHTAHFDWQLAQARGRAGRWPYDAALAGAAQTVLAEVWAQLGEIHAVSEPGIRVLADGLRFGGGIYHAAGWNPRPVEGVEHFIFYALEALTGRKFIHGQPVCLGVYLGALMQGNRADEVLAAIAQVGVDIRPEAMGITWAAVATALRGLRRFVAEQGLWYTIADEFEVTEEFLALAQEQLAAHFGPGAGG